MRTTPSSDTTATDGLADPLSSLGLEKRVSQGPGIEGATSLHTGGEAAGGSRSAGAGRRGGGEGPGTAEPSPERDANRLSWDKVNKGHAPCRRPAGAHPPLRPPPVHFHSLSASPPPDSRAALESLRARELSMLPPRAAPACTQPGEGATGRRQWPPEGVWDPAGCT
ncbi:uncharacterized protein LOC117016534 isoform X1 [Rhinolophus ferrumequinum]|uniref:uncharacterized protein LOC117016534 isoform X1 n=1 Tax=Rhinolophus ferrumequinum TaxID=59479 RepID=UPI00140F6CE1|nr:uncharacterized protein LOC117016534 isoform X1 [Rhinolophus ferrumequinum]